MILPPRPIYTFFVMNFVSNFSFFIFSLLNAWRVVASLIARFMVVGFLKEKNEDMNDVKRFKQKYACWPFLFLQREKGDKIRI